MAKRRGAEIDVISEKAMRGNSDGAKALSMWSTHGFIIKPGTSARSRADQKQPAPLARAANGSPPEQSTNGKKVG